MKNSVSKLLSAAIITSVIGFTNIVSGMTKSDSTFLKNDTEKIEQMIEKLVNKLLISKDQTEAIRNILEEYFKGVLGTAGDAAGKESLKQSANKKISAQLDKKQKMKFDIIEIEWWTIANE
jgi:hypothetical protein